MTKSGRQGAKLVVHSTLRSVVAMPWSRKLLNALYTRMSPRRRAAFSRRVAKIFRDRPNSLREGQWRVEFAGKPIVMPLTSQRLWLDWDSAVSILGHDAEVKETYEAFITSPTHRPDLFIDIGANYGTHSLLFLVHGIDTLTFEPNRSCHDYFLEICRLNNVTPTLHHLALGERAGTIELTYPEHDTWLGSTNAEVTKQFDASQKLITETVKVAKLDDFTVEATGKRVLIKIDTEGNELTVLRGAERTLSDVGPTILFECWHDKTRKDLFASFSSHGYVLFHLPWGPDGKSTPLSAQEFQTSDLLNFVAVPQNCRSI